MRKSLDSIPSLGVQRLWVTVLRDNNYRKLCDGPINIKKLLCEHNPACYLGLCYLSSPCVRPPHRTICLHFADVEGVFTFVHVCCTNLDLTPWTLEENCGPKVREATARASLLRCCSMKLLRSTANLYPICDVVIDIAQSCIDQTQPKIHGLVRRRGYG